MDRRNLLIKISNYPPVVRPQSGVNQADLVYEYEVEGGVTRFAAIFRSNAPTHVGPVRSGRLMDLNLVPMYEALFSYSGASAPIQQLFLHQPWRPWIISPAIGDNCEEAGFCRFPEEGKAFEHTLYADTTKVWERATARGVNEGHRARGFAFSDVADAGGGRRERRVRRLLRANRRALAVSRRYRALRPLHRQRAALRRRRRRAVVGG